jgi:hypothetical protein
MTVELLFEDISDWFHVFCVDGSLSDGVLSHDLGKRMKSARGFGGDELELPFAKPSS